MSVTLLEVLAAARARRASVVAETAGYLVLALADQVVSAPRRIAAGDAVLMPDGSLRAVAGDAASDEAAANALRALLTALMEASGSSTPGLGRAAHAAGGGASLIRALETALVPVNRAAARRALARLHRETERALALGVQVPAEPSARATPPLPVERAVEVAVAPPVSDDRMSEPAPSPLDVPVVVLAPPPPASAERLEAVEPAPRAFDELVEAPLDLTPAEPIVARANARRLLDDERAGEGTPVLGTRVAAAAVAVAPLVLVDADATEPTPEVALSPSPPSLAALAPVVERAEAPNHDAPRLDAWGVDDGEPILDDDFDIDESMSPEPALIEQLPEPALIEQLPEPALIEESPEPALIEQLPEPALLEESPELALLEESSEPALLAESSEPALLAEPLATAERWRPLASPEPADATLDEAWSPAREPADATLDEAWSPAPEAAPLEVDDGGFASSATPSSDVAATATLDEPPRSRAEPTPCPEAAVDEAPIEPEPSHFVPAPARFAPRRSDVSALIGAFAPASPETERELRRDLKALAGLSATPPPAMVEPRSEGASSHATPRSAAGSRPR
ncbi:MAG: hypothetical protein OZ921_16115 [Sorangiineae bacterium]|nr:hypothetical protein [Sorangiineae bacterium]MEB2343293.1 hypothetical protein [Deltaproteobacteria bacterium]